MPGVLDNSESKIPWPRPPVRPVRPVTWSPPTETGCHVLSLYLYMCFVSYHQRLATGAESFPGKLSKRANPSSPP